MNPEGPREIVAGKGYHSRLRLQSQWMRDALNLPNLFTGVRLVLAPFVIRAVIAGEHRLALVLFAIAAVTDFFDGALARRFGTSTSTGAYLDPIADKLLLSGVYLALAFAGILPWWFVGLIFGRDLLILAGAGIALIFTDRRKFPPTFWGKLSTLFQVITAVAWLFRNAVSVPGLDAVAHALIWPTAAATLWSGVHYGWRVLRAPRSN